MTVVPPGGAGRFAPSPTGPLHLGSLLAATASYLDARQAGIHWRVRLDDLDAARNQPGADDIILRALEAHGLLWDGSVDRQSEHLQAYAEALAALERQGRLFYCRCSRKGLRGLARYPGTCRARTSPRGQCAARLRVDDATVDFEDLLQGSQQAALAQTGDFIVRRRDGVVAYQLATAVDDGDRAITRVIRGRDLLHTTSQQVFVMQLLGLDVPLYGHLPLLLNRQGQKLSKQNLAPPLNLDHAAGNLAVVLEALGADPGPQAARRSCADLLEEAQPRFSLARVPAGDRNVSNAESGPAHPIRHGE